MKLVYIDTSVLIAFFFQETNHKKYLKYFSDDYHLVSSEIILAEFYSFLARNDISIDEAVDILPYIKVIRPDQDLTEFYEKVLSFGYIKGADLFHIANALYIDPEGKKMKFLTHDIKQANLAKNVGFKVLT